MSLRIQCIQTLKKILEDKVFFNTLKSDFKAQDTAFANKLILTALRRKTVIDKLINSMLVKKIPQKNKILEHVLLAGSTEILYMETPDYAVINEYVNIAKKMTDKFSSSMVNALLHKVTLHKDKMRNAVEFPKSFKQILTNDYTKEQISLMEQTLLIEPPIDLTTRENPNLWAQRLNGTLFENGTIRLNSPRTKTNCLDGFDKGAWWVQDLAASLPVCLLGDIKDKKVLDMCAAPGGKTAQLLAKGASVTALDISSERLKTLEENISRLNLNQKLKTIRADGIEYLENTSDLFDIILLDVPCSATGTFRKHPEVLFFKTLHDIKTLQNTQQKMLQTASSHIKQSGQILYCTCSISRLEGEEQIRIFLKENPNFQLFSFDDKTLHLNDGKKIDKNIFDKQVLRTLPYYNEGDGGMDSFFAARLVYKNNRRK